MVLRPGLDRLKEAEPTSWKQLLVGSQGSFMSTYLTDLYWMLEEYWPLLMPKYEIGCKVLSPPPLDATLILSLLNQRRVFDSYNYVSCPQRSNIHLTDDPITAVRPRSVLTKSGREYSADTIVSEDLILLNMITQNNRASNKAETIFAKKRSLPLDSPWHSTM